MLKYLFLPFGSHLISPCIILTLLLMNILNKTNCDHQGSRLRFKGAVHNEGMDYSELLPEHTKDSGNLSFPEMIENHTLKVAVTYTTMDSIFKARLSNGSMANIYGSSSVAYGYLLDLKEIFHFRIKIVPSVGWITEGFGGAITGVGAQVHFGQADIGIDISKPEVYRARHLTFLHAIKQDRVAIMFRQPHIQMYRNILVRPFKKGLWKGVLESFIVILVSTIIISRRRNVLNILVPITGAMLGRSVCSALILKSSSKSTHIVLFVTSVFGLTMYSIYSAFIVSSLRRQLSPVHKFQDLIEFGYELLAQRSLPDFTNVNVRTRDGSYYTSIAKKNFINQKDSLHRLFHPVIEDARVSPEGGLGVGVAWFVMESDFYYLALQNNYTTKQICDISRLEPTPPADHPHVLAMFIAKNAKNSTPFPISRMREHFNRRILAITNRGLGHRHNIRFENEFQPKCSRRRMQLQQIRFYDLHVAYLIFLCGAGISVGIMVIVEVLIPNLWQIRERNMMIQSNNRHQTMESRFVILRLGDNSMKNSIGGDFYSNSRSTHD